MIFSCCCCQKLFGIEPIQQAKLAWRTSQKPRPAGLASHWPPQPSGPAFGEEPLGGGVLRTLPSRCHSLRSFHHSYVHPSTLTLLSFGLRRVIALGFSRHTAAHNVHSHRSISSYSISLFETHCSYYRTRNHITGHFVPTDVFPRYLRLRACRSNRISGP